MQVPLTWFSFVFLGTESLLLTPYDSLRKIGRHQCQRAVDSGNRGGTEREKSRFFLPQVTSYGGEKLPNTSLAPFENINLGSYRHEEVEITF